jgi:hypothetical protein
LDKDRRQQETAAAAATTTGCLAEAQGAKAAAAQSTIEFESATGTVSQQLFAVQSQPQYEALVSRACLNSVMQVAACDYCRSEQHHNLWCHPNIATSTARMLQQHGSLQTNACKAAELKHVQSSTLLMRCTHQCGST